MSVRVTVAVCSAMLLAVTTFDHISKDQALPDGLDLTPVADLQDLTNQGRKVPGMSASPANADKVAADATSSDVMAAPSMARASSGFASRHAAQTRPGFAKAVRVSVGRGKCAYRGAARSCAVSG